MDQIINDFTRALVPIVVAAIAAMVGILLNQARVWSARKIGAEETVLIEGATTQAVKAAKQVMQESSPASKKVYALSHAQLALDRLGIKIDAALLESWIEASLVDVKSNAQRDAPPPPAPEASPVTVVMASGSSVQPGPGITITTPSQGDSGMGAAVQG